MARAAKKNHNQFGNLDNLRLVLEEVKRAQNAKGCSVLGRWTAVLRGREGGREGRREDYPISSAMPGLAGSSRVDM